MSEKLDLDQIQENVSRGRYSGTRETYDVLYALIARVRELQTQRREAAEALRKVIDEGGKDDEPGWVDYVLDKLEGTDGN